MNEKLIRKSDLLPECVLEADESVQAKYFRFQCYRLAKYEESGDWYAYVFTHQPVARETALLNLMDRIPSEDFFRLVGEVWNDVSRIGCCCDFLGMVCRDAKEKGQPIGDAMMNVREKELHRCLPEGSLAYRAHNDFNQIRCSWTLDPDWAQRYADCFGYKRISTCQLSREGIYALFDRRHNSEVIVDVATIKIVDTVTLD